MYQALQRINNDSSGISDCGSDPLPRKFQTNNNFKISSEVHGVSSLTWRNSDNRCSVLTFLTLEANGHWRIVSVPLHCSDPSKCLGSGALVSMDCLHLVCPRPINLIHTDRQKVTKGALPGGTFSANSLTNRSFRNSTVQHQSQKRALSNKTAQNELLQNFCHKSLACSESSCLISNSSNDIRSSKMLIQSSEIDNVIKRSSRKKSRKKGKRGKKHHCNTGPTEPDILSEECPKVSSISETCHNNDVDCKDPSTELENSLPKGRVDSSETHKTCTSYSNGVDILEEAIPAFHKFSETHSWGTSKNQIQCKDSELSFCDGVKDTQVCFYDALHPTGYTDKPDTFLLESISSCSNNDDGIKFCHGQNQSQKERFGTDLSESQTSDFRKVSSCNKSLLNDIIDVSNHTNKTTHGSQCRNGSQVHVAVPGKRNKQKKAVSQISSFSKDRSAGDLHGRTGKENSHSVWQKVQRNGTRDSVDDLKKVAVLSQFGGTLEEASSLKKNCNAVEDEKQLKDTRNWKSKRGAGLKQECKFFSRKGSHIDMANSGGCAKFTMSQKEMLDDSFKVSDLKVASSVSRSQSQTNCPTSVLQGLRAKHMTPAVNIVHVSPNAIDSRESIYTANSSMKSETIEDLNYSLPKSCNSADQSKLIQVQSAVFLPLLSGNSVGQGQKNVLTEDCLQNHSSASVVQKWMPIGSRDRGLPNSVDNSSLEHSTEIWTTENTVINKLNCDSQNLVPKAGVRCMAQCSGYLTRTFPDDECRTPNLNDQDTSMHEEQKNKLTLGHCLNIESGVLNAFKSVPDKIAEAVNDAYRVQLASEAIEQASGHPIAEFERLLQYSSPVICRAPHLTCHACSRDPFCGVSLCIHETPNITLGCIWKWYEKHGNYGLEIKANDYENPKRLGDSRFSFCAYFVPYLSAVQLFRNCGSHSVDTNNKISGSELLDSCGFSETSERLSSVDHLPILSVLFPQPRKEYENYSPQECNPDPSSASAKDGASIGLAENTLQSDPELLFEYFESEQPQQRRPFYEKVKELIRGDGPLQYQGYGDPTTLDSVKLNDLHPRSWYSVAWYPIYRIPEGNFRSSFLTFHSLGHLVNRSARFDSQSVQAQIVSPVVGLQTYNAQSECWFHLRHSLLNQKKGVSDLNPSEVLKERLRTLEETASLMARAIVKKGNLTTVNRHPDYEFFCSRKRWLAF